MLDTPSLGAGFFIESLSIEATDQSLFLRPLSMGWGGDKKQLTFDGAAEYYRDMLIAPLQR